MGMTDAPQAQKATLLRSLHVPGSPLVLVNVWDAVSARVVSETPGVRAVATASHSVSYAHGLPDGEGLSADQAIEAARRVVGAVQHLPVTIDFERGYSPTAAGVGENVARLLETGAVGINLEDSLGDGPDPLRPIDEQSERIAAARAAGQRAGVPVVINARMDALAVAPQEWDDAMTRANAYLRAGADCVFVIGYGSADRLARAIEEIHGPVSVVGNPSAPPLRRLAELGVARISFGPYSLGLVLAHLRRATVQLTDLDDYPEELGFRY
ncbi:isocitrate lyase/phosphoenolpyruvate mutase family protein [Lysobacter korlensis]|uniref:Isocitrate lyase/phosphoenolpyruvate mutase family protein n=1 Tax=Lysobacter korlensis TaxID=553636 RepID=A0ABV6RTV2_9GAMM